MSNEELWELFPIILVEYKSEWQDNYRKEKSSLKQAIGIENIDRLNHIGSTAIPGLIAKPTIDILIEIKNDTDTRQLISNLEAAGYRYLEKPENPPPYMMFIKGYTPEGFKGQVFHVHVRYKGDWDELYFRDYLLTHPDIADEYGKLKIELQKKHKHNRDGYTVAKTDFIKRITNMARADCHYSYDND